MTEELQASTKTATSAKLSAWEVRRVQEKLNKRKYRYGQGHMLVAFACPQLRQVDVDQVGNPFRMEDARHGSKVIGRVFHVFRERGIAVVDVTEPHLQAWVRTCLIPDTVASGGNLPEVPQEPSPGGAPVDHPSIETCPDCGGNGYVHGHFGYCENGNDGCTCPGLQVQCPRCYGSGNIQPVPNQPQEVRPTEQICWECLGDGFTEPSVPCWKCGGSGKLPIAEVMP